jgi:predicted peroxiredoxin
VSIEKTEFDGVLAELREQGLKVTVCSVLNETWYIKDDGIFTGYIASGAELLELKSENKLNIRGIKSLG